MAPATRVLDPKTGKMQEARIPLSMAITIETSPGSTRQFRRAVETAIQLLQQAKVAFIIFCQNLGCPTFLEAKPMFYIGDRNRGVEVALRDLLRMYPNPHMTPKPQKAVTHGHVSELAQDVVPAHSSSSSASASDPCRKSPATASALDLGHSSSASNPALDLGSWPQQPQNCSICLGPWSWAAPAAAGEQWWQEQQWQEAHQEWWQQWWQEQQLNEAQQQQQCLEHQCLEYEWVEQLWQEQQGGQDMTMATEPAPATQALALAQERDRTEEAEAFAMDLTDAENFADEFEVLLQQATTKYLEEASASP